MNGNNLIGYNCEQVEALRETINNIAKQTGEELIDTLQNYIIIPMSEVWFAPEAIKFFESFAETVKSSSGAITEAFDTVRQIIQQVGINWAEQTKGECPHLPPIDPVTLNLSIAAIKSNHQGTIGIKQDEAQLIISKINDAEIKVQSYLESSISKLNAETSFLGNNQSESLQECFTKVSGEIHKIFTNINQLSEIINQSIAKYTEIAKER